ncbi:MAG: nucleotide exchange factor GrpE [Candidatus Paceibacterota bacterium]|jgi:molecular chaperone GrpE
MTEEKKYKEKIKGIKSDSKEIIEGLKDLLDISEKEKKEYFNGWQREKADFINYKNKEAERVGEIVSFSKSDMFLKILPIIDNLNLAERAISEDKKKDNNIKGLLMIKNQLEEVLKLQGLKEINCLGEKFNPNFAEAIEIIDSDGVDSGIVIEEIEKGYCFNGIVLRPAKVKISK